MKKLKQCKDPSVFDLKMEIKKQPGVSISKEDDTYYFLIDENKADMRWLKEHIQKTVEPDDYVRTFGQIYSAGFLLSTISKEVDFTPVSGLYFVQGDVCFLLHIPGNRILMEITDSVEGTKRLKVIISSALAGLRHLETNQHVRIGGRLSFNDTCGQFEFVAEELTVLPDKSLLHQFFETEKRRVEDVVREKIHSIDNWGDVLTRYLVLYNNEQTLEDFAGILSEKKTGVKLYPKRIRFTSANLAYTLQDLASDDKYQAICIIHGPFRDDYAMLDFCTAQVVEAMVKVKKPIFTGLGHPSDTPLICGFADYDAATAQELAIKIAVLRASNWMDLMQKKYGERLKPLQENTPEEKSHGVLHVLKRFLNW